MAPCQRDITSCLGSPSGHIHIYTIPGTLATGLHYQLLEVTSVPKYQGREEEQLHPSSFIALLWCGITDLLAT